MRCGKTNVSSRPKDAESLAEQLDLHIDHVRRNRKEEDIFFEILLKSGFPLTIDVEKITIEGRAAHSIAGGGMPVCLEKSLTLELIRAMAAQEPARPSDWTSVWQATVN